MTSGMIAVTLVTSGILEGGLIVTETSTEGLIEASVTGEMTGGRTHVTSVIETGGVTPGTADMVCP